MTDENPLLNDDERETDQRLREAFYRPITQAVENAQLEQCRAKGALVGELHRQFGSGVAMAYFHAGMSYIEIMAPHRHEIESAKHYGAFYDGFSEAYWVDLTDKQKEGPYA